MNNHFLAKTFKWKNGHLVTQEHHFTTEHKAKHFARELNPNEYDYIKIYLGNTTADGNNELIHIDSPVAVYETYA